MNLKNPASSMVCALAACACAHAETSASGATDLQILQVFANDYEKDVTFKEPVTFGVEVGGEFYTVDATPATEGASADVSVRAGAPEEPSFYYVVEDSAYLNKVARGDMNALTSMAKAFSSDYAPMDIQVQDGYQPDENFVAKVLPLTFHFWTKGNPELIPFGPNMTRKTHGSNTGVFYYQPGFRSGWFNILPGDHVNEDERSRDNPFPSMIILISGEVTGLIGGNEMTFKAGNAMLIPAGVSHEFINNTDEPAFGFLFMFGEGA